MLNRDSVASVVFLFLSVVLYVLISRFPEEHAYASVGAAFWPTVLATGLFIVSVILLVSSIRAGSRAHGERAPAQAPTLVSRVRLPGIVGVIGLYLLLLNYVGFVVGSILSILAMMLILGERRVLWCVVGPVALTGALVIVFGRLMSCPLPAGIGVFRAISLLVM